MCSLPLAAMPLAHARSYVGQHAVGLAPSPYLHVQLVLDDP